MLTNQIIQNAIDELKSITTVDFIVYQVESGIVASTGNENILNQNLVSSFIDSLVDSQSANDCHYIKVKDEGQTDRASEVRIAQDLQRHLIGNGGIELEQRVEVHELNTRLLIYLLFRHQFEIFIHGPLGMRVAVAVGISQYAPVLAYHHDVHAPGVDTDARQLDTFACHGTQPAYDLVVQGIDVPEEMSSRLNDLVGETCQFSLAKLAVLYGTQYGSSACGTQVHSQEKC